MVDTEWKVNTVCFEMRNHGVLEEIASCRGSWATSWDFDHIGSCIRCGQDATHYRHLHHWARSSIESMSPIQQHWRQLILDRTGYRADAVGKAHEVAVLQSENKTTRKKATMTTEEATPVIPRTGPCKVSVHCRDNSARAGSSGARVEEGRRPAGTRCHSIDAGETGLRRRSEGWPCLQDLSDHRTCCPLGHAIRT